MTLTLVPPSQPDKKRAIIEKLKAVSKKNGYLTCPICASQTVAKIEQAVKYVDGKRKPGQVLERDICAHCYKRGILSDLKPKELKPV